MQAIVSMEMDLSQKSFFLCLAAIKRLSKPLPFITTSLGVSGVSDLLHVCPEGLGAREAAPGFLKVSEVSQV